MVFIMIGCFLFIVNFIFFNNVDIYFWEFGNNVIFILVLFVIIYIEVGIYIVNFWIGVD